MGLITEDLNIQKERTELTQLPGGSQVNIKRDTSIPNLQTWGFCKARRALLTMICYHNKRTRTAPPWFETR